MFSARYAGKTVHFLRVNYTRKASKRQLVLAAKIHRHFCLRRPGGKAHGALRFALCACPPAKAFH